MIVSSIPLTGNKRKLWSQIEPLLPEGRVFIDMFIGGGTMALNATKLYDTVIGSEVVEPLVELHLAYKNDRKFLDKVTKLNEHYPSTKAGFLQLRKDYNVEPSPAKLQCLVVRSNSNMMRWNSKGEYNMTYGERNYYNLPRMQEHSEVCKDIQIISGGWQSLFGDKSPLPCLPAKDYVFYSDCPYSNSNAVYNESGGWTDADDIELLAELLRLQKEGCHVVASNTLIHKGKVNKRWSEFCKEHKDKFTVHHLNRSYANASFRKSSAETDEVLIVSK